MIEKSQLFLNPLLRCTHPEVVAWVKHAVDAAERRRWRSRRRRPGALEALHEQALLVVSNAAHALALGLEPPSVAIRLGRPDGKRIARYGGPALRQLAAALEAVSPGLVIVNRSPRGWAGEGTASMLLPSDELRERLRQLPGFDMDCFSEDGESRSGSGAAGSVGEEPIVLRRVSRNGMGKRRDDFEYAETAETRRLRAEMDRINAALEAADIVSPGGRRLQRVFHVAAEASGGGPETWLCGRLYYGGWQNVKRADKWGLRIDGQPVADLDYRNLHLRLAYIEKDLEPPPGDLYAGILRSPEEDRAYRDGVKQFVNALFNRATGMRRWPDGLSPADFPGGLKVSELRAAVFRRHAPIADIFETEAGRRFQRTDSDLLVAVLLKLLDLGIIALGMHDGLLVRAERAEAAKSVMEETALERLGRGLEVKVEKSPL